ncbi:MAG: DUF4394 domain-containing protein [Pleurocapsa sp. SU_196_0]|nr:DUF4394 domain-containing protein [Pleurocapsa sp. SU_196_0]
MNKFARAALIAPGMTTIALAFGACTMNTPVSPEAPRGRTMYATTQDNKMAKFGSENPNTSATTLAFSGMASGETMIGLDFGPRDGKLYGVSNQNRMYTIDVPRARSPSLAPVRSVLPWSARRSDWISTQR